MVVPDRLTARPAWLPLALRAVFFRADVQDLPQIFSQAAYVQYQARSVPVRGDGAWPPAAERPLPTGAPGSPARVGRHVRADAGPPRCGTRQDDFIPASPEHPPGSLGDRRPCVRRRISGAGPQGRELQSPFPAGADSHRLCASRIGRVQDTEAESPVPRRGPAAAVRTHRRRTFMVKDINF